MPAKKVWERIRKMKGDYHAFAIPILGPDDENTKLRKQANILREHFAHFSSTENYSDEFLKFKDRAKRVRLGGKRTV